MRAVVAVLLAVCSTWLFDQPAFAEKRVALVMRNSVDLKRDLSVSEMRRALRDFSDSVRDADIAIVYYAGHGIEINGSNYLSPVDAALESDIDVFDEAI